MFKYVLALIKLTLMAVGSNARCNDCIEERLLSEDCKDVWHVSG